MKLLLVIDVDDDVAKNYKEFTVNYDLRGDYGEWDESVKYVEDCHLKPMPSQMENMFDALDDNPLKELQQLYCAGYNKCLKELEK